MTSERTKPDVFCCQWRQAESQSK